MKLYVERVLKDKDDKTIGAIVIVDDKNRYPYIALHELIAKTKETTVICDNFIVTSNSIRAKKGTFTVGWHLTMEEMQEKYDNKWLLVQDTIYLDKKDRLSGVISGNVIEIWTTKEYKNKCLDYDYPLYDTVRAMPKGFAMMGGIF